MTDSARRAGFHRPSRKQPEAAARHAGTSDDQPVAVGVDIGGTSVRVGAVSVHGKLVDRYEAKTPDSLVALLDVAVEGIQQFPASLPAGIGVAGLVDREGVVRASPNLPLAAPWPVGALLRRRLSQDCVVINDATAAAHAEHRFGAARGHSTAMILTIGTGLGGGLIIGDVVQHGDYGMAGEFGHVIVMPDGHACGCGRSGCLETEVSGRALQRRAIARGWSTGQDMLAAAVSGDAGAMAEVGEMAHVLGAVLADWIAVIDPSAIVIGGGAGTALVELLAPNIDRYLVEQTYGASVRTLPQIMAAELGDNAGMVGAAVLAAGLST